LLDDYSPLWKLLRASYQVLNITNPNLTKHCWSCYGIKPPFYEAVGTTGEAKRVDGSNPAQCLWGKDKQGIIMAQVIGKGRCVG
ncbi:ENV2 protein, partial [Pardalotus punctatus]|nr:ENV2 protein [Pardalotus punctatus]